MADPQTTTVVSPRVGGARSKRRVVRWLAAYEGRRLRVAGRDAFTIVSNNCWGAAAYTDLEQPYRTPFVGLFLMPACYLRLVADFRNLIRSPLTFCVQSRYEELNRRRGDDRGFYPIGLLGADIEIHFLHYASAAEATAKWTRRVARMVSDDDRLFFKFCDGDRPSADELATFDHMPLRHKVCFVARPELASAVWIPGYEAQGCVPDGWRLYSICQGRFDLAGWLAGGSGRPALAYRARRWVWRHVS